MFVRFIGCKNNMKKHGKMCKKLSGYYTMPEEIEKTALDNGLKKVANLGLDFSFMASVINDISEEKFELFKPLYEKMTSRESCTGMSSHALLICRKNSN